MTLYSDKETGLWGEGKWVCPEAGHCLVQVNILLHPKRSSPLLHLLPIWTLWSHLQSKSQWSMGRNGPILQRRKLRNLLPPALCRPAPLTFLYSNKSLPLTYPHPHPFHHKSGQLSLQNISDIHLPLSISMAMTLTLVQATTTGHLDYCNELPFYLSDSRLGLLQIHYPSNSHSDFWQSGSQHPSALNNSLLLHEDLPSSSASLYNNSVWPHPNPWLQHQDMMMTLTMTSIIPSISNCPVYIST